MIDISGAWESEGISHPYIVAFTKNEFNQIISSLSLLLAIADSDEELIEISLRAAVLNMSFEETVNLSAAMMDYYDQINSNVS